MVIYQNTAGICICKDIPRSKLWRRFIKKCYGKPKSVRMQKEFR